MLKHKVDKPVITDLIISQRQQSIRKKPSDHTIALMLLTAVDGGRVRADCIYGCKVEADGVCEHGHSSWLLKLGYI